MIGASCGDDELGSEGRVKVPYLEPPGIRLENCLSNLPRPCGFAAVRDNRINTCGKGEIEGFWIKIEISRNAYRSFPLVPKRANQQQSVPRYQPVASSFENGPAARGKAFALWGRHIKPPISEELREVLRLTSR